MRCRRPFIVWLCLLALVWCQVAMAAQACRHDATADTGSAMLDCHDNGGDETIADDAATCPGNDMVPDWSKLPTVAALQTGHDFLAAASLRTIAAPSIDRTEHARGRPDLDALCRLLI